MNTNTIERILLGFGSVVLLGFAASYFVDALKDYNGSLRIAAIAGVVLYAGYSFLVQTNDQKEIFSAEKEAEKHQTQAKKEKHRADDLQSANKALETDLAEAKKEIAALQQRLEALEEKGDA